MNQYILLLRGINVGGHRKIKMADLRLLLQNLDYANVQTYIQSGNILLESDQEAAQIASKVKAAIKAKYDFDVPTLVMLWKDLEAIVEKLPFENVEEEKALYFTFLEKKPDAESVERLEPKLLKGEAYQIIDKTIYLYCPNGYGRTKLTNDFWEKQLKVAATTRNWKTTKKLLEMGRK